jgi:DNA adenine methylase
MLYLSTLAFNGIYRVNRAGQFNVPYGERTYGEDLWTQDKFNAYSEALKTATLSSDDFAPAVARAQPTDLIYFDPPYTVTHENNGFVKYNQQIFSWEDQQRLAQLAADLSCRGCQVVVSNAFHPTVRRLYPDFIAHVVSRSSTMAADTTKRRHVHEYLFHSDR